MLKDSPYPELVNKILLGHMSLEEEIEAMRAQCTNFKQRENAKVVYHYQDQNMPRFTDKEYILRNAASKLRDNHFQEANLYI